MKEKAFEEQGSWVKISGFEDYEVCDDGRIMHHAIVTSDGRHLPKRIIKGIPDKDGYLMVGLFKDGKRYPRKVHRLVAEAFLPNPNEYRCVNHIDGDKKNNNARNLEWCTHSQNMVHAYATGLRVPIAGERNVQHKLTESDVRWIRNNCVLRDKDFGARAMARRFGVTNATIRKILMNERWKTVS